MKFGNRRGMAAAALILAFISAACAPTFPQQMLDKVDRNLSFKELQSDPDKYKGTWTMLAGVIVVARNTKEGTLFEVMQKPMDHSGQPLQTDDTGGRFLLFADQFLDIAVYHPGRQLTVIGEVTGQKIQALGEMEYRYPVIAEKSLRLWEPSAGPRFMFGVGIGVSTYH